MVEALAHTRTPEEDRGKYWALNVMGVKDYRFKKGQISYAHKMDSLKADRVQSD